MSYAAAHDALVIALYLVGAAVYFAPTVVAIARRSSMTAQVVVVNLLLGWTVVVWVVALIMATRPKSPAL